MTRFARAKGSKSSNERVPEEATSWTELKKQLDEKLNSAEEAKKRKEVDEARTKKYKEFLQEKENEKTANTVWADLSDLVSADLAKRKKSETADVQVAAKTKKKRSAIEIIGNNEAGDEHVSKRKRKKKDVSVLNGFRVEDVGDTQLGKSENGAQKGKQANKTPENPQKKTPGASTEKQLKPFSEMTEAELKKMKNKQEKKKRKTQKRKIKRKAALAATGAGSVDGNGVKAIMDESTKLKQKGVKGKLAGGLNSKAQLKKEIAKKPIAELTEDEKLKLERKKQKRLKQMEKRKAFKDERKAAAQTEKNQGVSNKEHENTANKTADGNNNNNNNNNTKNFQKRFTPQKPLKPIKQKTPAEHKRRKPLEVRPLTIMLNGEEVDLKHFDGYPVKKEDHDRLTQLKKEMISKGIPRSEVQHALKLERRKAEKALARDKKNVCFKCRKSGHVLSECPNLVDDQDSGAGICYKCGSTEHSQFVCRVVREPDFKFATCFICKEQGHISRQCPDNARGLYPKGGACRVCGDVTHLKKDCPQFQQQQQQQADGLYAERSDGGNIEALDDGYYARGGSGKGDDVAVVADVAKIRPNKIVKF